MHCNLSDICTSVLFNPGFIILVHAPLSCSNIIYNATVNMQRRLRLHFKQALPIVTDKIFLTGISDKEAIFGGEDLLKRSIERVLQAKNPECLLVVAGCTAGVIGDDVIGVCESAGKKYNIPIIAVPGAGFMSKQEQEGHLLVTKYLYERVKDNTVTKNPRAAVILGLNKYLQSKIQQEEIARIFAYFGFTELILPPCGMAYNEIKKMNEASLIAVQAVTKAKLAAYQEFAQDLGDYLQIGCLTQNLPFGVEETYAYLHNLGLLCHKEAVAEKAVTAEKARWQEACSKLGKLLIQKRYVLAIDYNLKVSNPFNVIELLCAVGMELSGIVLLSSLTEKEILAYQDFFQKKVLDVPVVLENSTAALPHHDIVITSSFCSKFTKQYCYKRRRIGIGGAIHFLQGVAELVHSGRSVYFE